VSVIWTSDSANVAMDLEAAQLTLTKAAADTLEKHYPGWGWMVGVDLAGGVLDIRSARIPGPYGYRLRLMDVDYEGRAIWRAGGEILERYGLERKTHRPGMTLELERDFNRNPVPADD
jgi:hypothetical protein